MAHLKLTINKCAEFSSFGETTFLWEWLWAPYLAPDREKKFLQFFWNFAQLLFGINKCTQFSSFGETTFFMGIKFNFKFQNWDQFYKGFPCKKKLHRNSWWNEPRSKLKGIFLSFFHGGQINNFLVKQVFYGKESEFQLTQQVCTC